MAALTRVGLVVSLPWLTLVATGAAGCTAHGSSIPPAIAQARAVPEAYVAVSSDGNGFVQHGRRTRLVGVNLWYGPNLAAPAPLGDPARLERELDHLHALGLDDLRVLAISEGPNQSPWRLTPTAEPQPGSLDPEVYRGLDRLLEATRRRGMRVVLCLGNFWFWSGGVAQRRAWAGRGEIPYPDLVGSSWQTYSRFAADFWIDDQAKATWRATVRAVVGRTSEGGRAYRDDPTIAAWELMNEPRGGAHGRAMQAELDAVAQEIHALDPHHLVTTGSEGSTADPADAGADFERDHQSPAIDFSTIHVWPQNWGWYDPKTPSTYAEGERRALAYVREHLGRSAHLHKPVVVEELGLARDAGSFTPGTPTTARDRFLASVSGLLVEQAGRGGPVGGIMAWAWSGEGRPSRPGEPWRSGEPWIGDPPHEPGGWYGIDGADKSTLEVLTRAASQLR